MNNEQTSDEQIRNEISLRLEIERQVHFERAALIPIPRRAGDLAVHEFVGTSDAGETIALSFSQIESFTVVAKTDETITLSVTVWPDISPKALLQTQPGYEQLYAGYRRSVVLHSSLKSADGRLQAFAGEWLDDPLPLGRLPKGATVNFYDKHPSLIHPLRYWWAIPSVAKDEKYPHRLRPAAR